MELGGGDSWDTDAWGAGFSAEDETVHEIEIRDVPDSPQPAVAEEQPDSGPEQEPVTEPAVAEVIAPEQPVAEVLAVPEAEPEPEPEPQPEPAPEPEPEPATIAPIEIETTAIADVEPVVEEPEVPEPEVAEPTPEPAAEPQFVAYSPQLPADEDLPHFAPKGPTVREFFTALGSYRPPSQDGSSITAHAASAELTTSSDYPLAADAFSNLFADSAVSEEDSRAAFALSGALGAPEPPSAPTAAAAPPAPAAPQSSSDAQESEEDIRRFREWLDGLADS
jgi:hypothetical protein